MWSAPGVRPTRVSGARMVSPPSSPPASPSPGAVLLGRLLPPGAAASLPVPVGVLAGLVQVLGLPRRPYAVPARRDHAGRRARVGRA
ncbi:hypothetical protein [Nonomuraea solani]|uniref:hypothetical protein n=1 Tax=Nonomuraea solani TaxID=1144553 RepID=UPI001357A9A7|nr:hypothetical protein [Nonomuraea solani]